MTVFLKAATPLLLSLCFGLISVAASLISKGRDIGQETDTKKRHDLATFAIRDSLPQSLCLSSFSFDLWVITVLFSSDDKTKAAYNLSSKGDVVQLLLVSHVVIYITVLAWGGIVRGAKLDQNASFRVEFFCSVAAVLLCIGFQVY